MAENEILRNAAASLKRLEPLVAEARDLITAMEEAGEDTSSLRADLSTRVERMNRWRAMLEHRGLLEGG